MEKMIEAHCQQLLHDIVSLIILDLVACFIFFIIMRWIGNVIENRFLFLRALHLQFLLSYLLDKLCPKYITLILSYIYISMCKSILPKSILNIDFYLVTRNRGKVFFSMCKSKLPKSILKIDFSLVTTNRWRVTFFLLCLILLNFYVMITDKFYPKLLHYLKFYPRKLHYLCYLLISHSYTQYNKAPIIEEALNKTESTPEVDTKDVRINRDELLFVMERIGEPTTKEGEQTDNFCMEYGEFSALFQESEPSLDEVKLAFSVFDQNRDGLIDAQDLQRVLSNLGLREGTNLEACQRMIGQHDRNKDGNVDSIDFSRLLEMSLLGNGD